MTRQLINHCLNLQYQLPGNWQVLRRITRMQIQVGRCMGSYQGIWLHHKPCGLRGRVMRMFHMHMSNIVYSTLNQITVSKSTVSSLKCHPSESGDDVIITSDDGVAWPVAWIYTVSFGSIRFWKFQFSSQSVT